MSNRPDDGSADPQLQRQLQKSLRRSAQNRAAIIEQFGFVPLSVIHEIQRGALSRQMFIYQQENPERSGSATARMHGPGTELRRALGIVGGVLGPAHNAINATTMPAELVDFFVKYYAQPGDVYLDPFMGQGIQMQVAKLRGLHYYGYDISREFFEYIAAVRDKIDDGTTTLHITCGDSCHPDEVPDGIGDFSFHSPPYWDIEFYGEEPEQLGYQRTYPEFLEGMEQVAAAWLPKFRSGATMVVNVNDFRKEGKFYTYHADTISLFRRAGWVMHDLWVIKGLVGGLPKLFGVDFNMKRIAPKCHEYCLVFKKP